jgi:hypothetical protein
MAKNHTRFRATAVAMLALVGTSLFALQPIQASETAAEGIQVNADWVIEVSEPDGTVVDRREFSNALVGPNVLAWALGGRGAINIPVIKLTNCWEASNSAVPCFVSATSNQPEQWRIDAPETLILEGSIVVSLPTIGITTVTEVATVAATCQPGVDTPISCRLVISDPPTLFVQPLGVVDQILTATTLASPVNIADGQTVNVTVTITFS